MGKLLHAMKRRGVGYEDGLIRLRRAGSNFGRPLSSLHEGLWKDAFSKKWQSDFAFGEFARDICRAGWQLVIEKRPEEEAERRRWEQEIDKLGRDDLSPKSITATGDGGSFGPAAYPVGDCTGNWQASER
jgi:hypothetical protein